MNTLIIANWKQNVTELRHATELFERYRDTIDAEESSQVTVVLCPAPAIIHDIGFLVANSEFPDQLQLGSQDIAIDPADSQLGEKALSGIGARYVIVGHSDRRWKAGESDAMVNTKLKAALGNSFTPVVCCGEVTREDGWRDTLVQQIKATCAGLSPKDIERCLIAYEPVWAISDTPGARPDDPVSAGQSLALINSTLQELFGVEPLGYLYGGSVNKTNIAGFLALPTISGVLVGRASLEPEFADIIRFAFEHPLP